MPNDTRRGFLGLFGCGLALAAVPAWALDTGEARALIQRSLDEVYAVINSGQPPEQMFKAFEAIFARYADVDIIARSALGPAARGADPAQFAAYRQAFQGYIGRKYGKRFREFIGSKIEVKDARPVKSFFAVTSIAYLKGRSPMEVEWHVSDKSGRSRYFNIIIEGVNMLASERAEIGAMLARRKGDLSALTADLTRAG
ncbi:MULTISPECIES: MlaC/ttg2D family ABC transporter substrate-binding protein [unclassified Paracoccus (in: a-proteobacteria)]|uniref:MlaC/ttg2D family ABC transporter substrate-binding protein n=1 Tax=unclassified Paracoccus (in: a-proteobacteria) TaxID=2688777 RepID=UPI0012B1F1A4|nr:MULTISPECIES: ABC transporter substrate-binding protein [unclassified Paracoccus (in: a-proteobacteria)]UXU76251.1 ABC transporter substrate-binding protein [Paracoccus sp. SMMA_5]UXU82141.1 ABC transporter substrate-binding protein [Paracoccus sp. SMMA_5_TC]